MTSKLKNHYCTMFNSRYLLQGLALYESLKKECSSFHLYVVAFDDACWEILNSLSLERVTIIKLENFESERLLSVKSTRSCGEYFWTSTPYLILYCLKEFQLPSCTYIDADIYFYSDPAALIAEMAEDASVLITEHRYTKHYDRTETSGKYCVQFMTFKNDPQGLKVLHWWYDRCIEWCYAREEDGKFGDQKYLDHWTSLFTGVHELQHLGGGVAPWNVQQYDLSSSQGQTKLFEKSSQIIKPVVFYHFHSFRFLTSHIVDLGSYELDKSVKTYIYGPYIKHLSQLHKELLNFQKYSFIYPSYKNNFIHEMKKLYWNRKNISSTRGLLT